MYKIKKIISRILKPNTHSSEAYVNYLRKKGIKIGENTRFVSPKNTFIDIGRADYITIGNNCCFSRGAIIAHDYSWYTLLNAYEYILPDPGGSVTIGNNVFVGFESVILPNVKIGDNVIIGARSLVTKNIPDNTIWAGNPARQIGELGDYFIKKKKNELGDAIKRYKKLKDMQSVTIENMGFFSFLFLKRNEENYLKYIKKLEFNGIKDSNEIKDYFYNTKPEFNSFSDFINYAERDLK